ncbi:uroporphyrinogen decarboxylase family protein [Intestinimonas sp.]|uniref:uroporphyrinogen decarboxylase family protein n=1 Tax=Intestinimonas sp. TaxID=1965293 RepID=UPI0026372363|nr:uroporphyrinogen decarboxylase family protein [Intestinimonas sp.]
MMYTPKENFIHFYHNEPVEWTPMADDMRMFQPEEFNLYIARGFVFQQQPFPPEKFGGPDWFGVEWTYDPVSRGSMEVAHPLSEISEWEEKITFPNLDDYDWEGIGRKNADYLNTDKMIATTIFSGFFERLISFVGFENAAIALIDEDEQEEVHRLFSRLADLYIDYIRRFHEHYGAMHVCIHDDWGTQRGLIFSPDIHEEMVRPYIQRVIDAVHAMGMSYEQHSCGNMTKLVPALIEMGVDTWLGQDLGNANHKDEMLEAYGDRFKFGVTLPKLSTTDLEASKPEIRAAVDKYAPMRVWLRSERSYTPEQKAYTYQYVRELGSKQ